MRDHVLWIFLVLFTLTGCRQGQETTGTINEGQSVYYWRTDLHLDSTERAFLRTHHINKVYCRYFDVVMKEGEPMPNATLRFSDTLPTGIEVVPTVYITEDCMHAPHPGLAEKVVRRICQMNETNDLGPVTEIQIDCDYTARSRKVYYDFLKGIHYQLSIINCQLSTTIRLHQMSMPVPPVDYGVLMIYNTGDPGKFMERNPILDLRDVQPYLRYLNDYQLPLAAAYPVYQWVRTISGVNITHEVEADEVLQVKKAVEAERDDLRHTILLYHLDSDNINRYEKETFDAIYRH